MKENETLKKLPLEVQEEVIEILKSWSGCYVLQNEITKKYSVEVGIGITSCYNPNKCVASFKSYDIYTNDEIYENNKRICCDWF